jgi:hypothetical protein
MTPAAALRPHRQVLVGERSLLLGVALEANRVPAGVERTSRTPPTPYTLWQSLHWIRPTLTCQEAARSDSSKPYTTTGCGRTAGITPPLPEGELSCFRATGSGW